LARALTIFKKRDHLKITHALFSAQRQPGPRTPRWRQEVESNAATARGEMFHWPARFSQAVLDDIHAVTDRAQGGRADD
jgi:hypothetical protein